MSLSTSGLKSAISAMPPALSLMGPKPSMVRPQARVANLKEKSIGYFYGCHIMHMGIEVYGYDIMVYSIIYRIFYYNNIIYLLWVMRGS